MRTIFALLLVILWSASTLASDLVSKSSPHDVPTTMDRLEAAVTKAGLSIFVRIDHQANAQRAGLQMRAAQVLIFGNPKMGTAMMRQDTASGLDLPLRVLVYEDEDGSTRISYHNPQGMKDSYRLEGNAAVGKAEKGLANLTNAAAQP